MTSHLSVSQHPPACHLCAVAGRSLQGNKIGDAGAKTLFELTRLVFGRGKFNLYLREIEYGAHTAILAALMC